MVKNTSKNLFILVIIFVLFLQPYSISVAQSNLKYFGYFGVWTQQHLNEIINLDNSNILILRYWNTSILASYPGNVIMTVPTSLQEWNNFTSSITDYIDKIYGFYIDEPVWKGISKSDFLLLTKLIHDTYPGKAILVIEASPPILNNTIPDGYYQYVTDIGFDYYFTARDTSNEIGWEKYLNIYESFKPYIQNKKYWIVTDGWCPDSSDCSTHLRWPDAFERYYNFSTKTPNTVGMLSYIYKTFDWRNELRDALMPDGKFYMPDFRNRFIQVGQSIVTPTFKPGDVDSDNDIDIFDYNLLIENFGLNFTSADFDQSGIVDINDYNILIYNFDK